MKTIGERLRLERERLGLSQLAFGDIGGVQRGAQINYEAGTRNPDSQYLAAIAAAGADILYIVTGQRAGAAESTLSPRERDLLDNYRHTDPLHRGFIEDAASVASEASINKAAA